MNDSIIKYSPRTPLRLGSLVPCIRKMAGAALGLSMLLACEGVVCARTPASAATAPSVLGVYLGNPNGSSASSEANYEAGYRSFVSTMQDTPKLIDAYVDYTQPVVGWASNASWQAWSNAQSVDAKSLTPVIGFPMASIASGSSSADLQFQKFALGYYDSAIQGVVQAWAQQGFKLLVFRVGWEMNIQGPTYSGSDSQSESDWVAAFKHIYTVLHSAAAANGVTTEVVWNPSTTNYSQARATMSLYPGDAFVDVIGADVYSDIYPYSDGGSSPTYHDWDTGLEDTSVAQFIADPVNRMHYWSYPAATKWSNDGSGGASQSLTSLLAFAKLHNKPFAIPEAGAGNSNAQSDVCDDAAFPQWLALQLTNAIAAGQTIAFVNIWDNNGGGNYEFSYAADNKPQEAAAWAKYIGAVAQ